MRVTDNGFPALDTTRSFTITVDEVNLPPSLASIPDQTVGESNPLIFQATASDPDFPANSLTFSLDYGAPAGATIDPTSGLFSWTPSEAQGPGIYPITVRVTDNGSPVLNTIQTFTVTVNEVNQPPVINAGPDQTVSEGQTVAFTGSFTDPDVPPPPNGFTIQWNFGDGATAQASLTAIHAYGDNGVYTVTLTLGDGAGGVSTDTLKVTVINVAPIVEAGDDKTSFTDQPGRFSGSFTDPGTLDTHQIVWTFGDGGASTSTLTPSHSFKSPGVYTVTLTVTDKDGAVGSDSLVVTVQQSTYSIYMPVMYSTGKPDLVGNFSLSPQKTTYEAGEPVQITVVVTNQGNGPTGSFWADFYINPSHPPTGFNQTWDELCSLTPCFGITWYVEGGLNPGESLTLTSTLGIYSEEHSYWLGWLASGASDLYLVVDSWNSTGSTGMVQERDETNNVTELHGLQVTGPNPPLGGPSPGIPSLPRRLQPDNQY
jgi:PKD repeat protein